MIASGLLLLALALVVIYTGPNAFYSPVALVVVAAIGLAALLLQVWFRRDLPNIILPSGLTSSALSVPWSSLFADYLRMTRRMLDLVAFAAVVCFGISGSLILHALRRRVRTPQSTAEQRPSSAERQGQIAGPFNLVRAFPFTMPLCASPYSVPPDCSARNWFRN